MLTAKKTARPIMVEEELDWTTKKSSEMKKTQNNVTPPF